MDVYYHFEVSSDSVNFSRWEGKATARYVKILVDEVEIYQNPTSPSAYLSGFTVYADSDKWERVNSTLEFSAIDNLFA